MTEHLPESDSIAPHVTLGSEPQVSKTLRSVPAEGNPIIQAGVHMNIYIPLSWLQVCNKSHTVPSVFNTW